MILLDTHAWVWWVTQDRRLSRTAARAIDKAQVAGALEWHINADEPIALDYNEEFKSPVQQIKFYNPDYYRASDHDPVVAGLNLGATAPGQGDLYLPLISR